MQLTGVSPPSEDKSKKAVAVSGTAAAASVVQKVDTAPSASEGEPSPKKAKPAGNLLNIYYLIKYKVDKSFTSFYVELHIVLKGELKIT